MQLVLIVVYLNKCDFCFSLLGFFCTMTGMLSTIGAAFRSAAASEKIHEALLDKTMHAPLSFFETTPIGRILNRFTSDIDVIDSKISQQLRSFLSCIAMISGTFFVVSIVTPYFLIPLGPILIVYFFPQGTWYMCPGELQLGRLR